MGPELCQLFLRRIYRDIPLCIYHTEKAKRLTAIRAELVKLPWRNGDKIPFFHFHHIMPQQGVPASTENNDHMHMFMMLQ